jgi:nitrogen PTS system EIIA component
MGMAIKELFSKNLINFDLKSKDKEQVIDELIELLANNNKLVDVEAFKKAVQVRESQFSTGIGMGIAIPHGKGSFVNEIAIAYGRSAQGLNFDAIDEEQTYHFFMLAVPEGEADTHLRAVAEISRRLMHKEVRDKLFNAGSYEEFLAIW